MAKETSDGRLWSREEVLHALSLYCVLPFGKFDQRNRDVIALANRLGRTPSAVAMKLANLASLDPEEEARGIRGMQNTSQLDRSVWAEFYGHWDELAEALPPLPDDDLFEPAEVRIPPGPTTVERVLKVRRGHQFFQRAVLGAYERSCCITGISEPRLLRASHIVPWSKSEEHRLNPRNRLCLNALHDAAFDRGLITFDDHLRLLLSPELRATMRADLFNVNFAQYEHTPIRMPSRYRPDIELMRSHRIGLAGSWAPTS